MWGHRVHKAAQEFLQKGKPLDPELTQYQLYLEALQRLPGVPYAEKKLALNIALQPVDFFARDVWVRGVADYLTIDDTVARAVDHKTGARKPDSRQMVLLALLVFHTFPEVMTARTAFFWMKSNEKDTEVYQRADIPAMWNMFVVDLKQYREAFHTETWQPRQSGLCYGWCPVTTCEFWKPKRVRSK